MVKPVRKLTRVPTFVGTTATFMGTFSAPARTVVPAESASATPAGVTFGPTPNSVPAAVRRTHHPAEARNRGALFEPSEKHHPFIERGEASAAAVELPLGLPAELRDDRRDFDAALLQRAADARAEQGEADARAGETQLLHRRRRLPAGLRVKRS
jgi:hypothetical protein